MISAKVLTYLLIGTCAMLLPILIQAIWYRVKLWKGIAVAVIITVAGTIGAYILFYIENHWIGGASFYGAVFIMPIVFLLIAKLLRMPYGEIMDMCAPAGCVMLMIMKFQCFLSGCCSGRTLYVTAENVAVKFPSQLAEILDAFIILVALLLLAHKKPKRGDMYPLFMVIYGVTRFCLNLLREKNAAFFIGLPAGNVWSLVSIIVGTIWLIAFYKKRKDSAEKLQQECI